CRTRVVTFAAVIPVAIGGAFDPPASQPKRVQSLVPGGPPPEAGPVECDGQASAISTRDSVSALRETFSRPCLICPRDAEAPPPFLCSPWFKITDDSARPGHPASSGSRSTSFTIAHVSRSQ